MHEWVNESSYIKKVNLFVLRANRFLAKDEDSHDGWAATMSLFMCPFFKKLKCLVSTFYKHFSETMMYLLVLFLFIILIFCVVRQKYKLFGLNQLEIVRKSSHKKQNSNSEYVLYNWEELSLKRGKKMKDFFFL